MKEKARWVDFKTKVEVSPKGDIQIRLVITGSSDLRLINQAYREVSEMYIEMILGSWEDEKWVLLEKKPIGFIQQQESPMCSRLLTEIGVWWLEDGEMKL